MGLGYSGDGGTGSPSEDGEAILKQKIAGSITIPRQEEQEGCVSRTQG